MDSYVDSRHEGIPSGTGMVKMKTIQMTIDEELLAEVDRTASDIGANRSAFIREALQHEIRRHKIAKLEAQHAAGYKRLPVQPGEFDAWETEQVWGDE